MKRTTTAAIILAIAAILAAAGSARAVDGTIEINQAKVTAAGGFPYAISSSGSYRLTGNLTVSAANTNAINVNASRVTIDLNGFSIVGPGGSTTGYGIIGTSYSDITVENGTVTGFYWGVALGTYGIVKSVHADANSTYGIFGATGSVIEDCTANSVSGSSFYGILCNGSSCVISGNSTNSNSSTGIYCAGSSCVISHNTVSGNTVYGIFASDSTTGYGENVLNGNGTNALSGTSMKNNVCNGAIC